MRETHDIDALAMLVGGVVPSGPRIGLRRLGQAATDVALHAGHVETAGEAVELRFDLPPGSTADVLRLALALLPGRYRIGRLRVGARAVADLPSRVWGAGVCPGHDAWIHVVWEAGTTGPEIDVRGLLDDASSPVRIAVARTQDEGSDFRFDPHQSLATQQRLQAPLGAAVARLAQRVDGLMVGVAEESVRLRTAIESDAAARNDAWSIECAHREDRLQAALQGIQQRLNRMESERADTLWRRVRSRLRGAG
jgi:hypothetical protein